MPIGKWDEDCGRQGHKTPYEAVRYTRLCANMYIITKKDSKTLLVMLSTLFYLLYSIYSTPS